MIGTRGARTGEPADAGDAGVEELVDVEDEGVSVDGGEGVGARERDNWRKDSKGTWYNGGRSRTVREATRDLER